MTTPELLALTGKVSHLHVQSYLRHTGWKSLSTPRKHITLWRKRTEEAQYDIELPTEPTLYDYPVLLLRAAESVTQTENRAVEAVVSDWFRPSADVIRFRLQARDTEDGSIGLERGIQLLQGGQKLLLATACDEVEPLLWHKRQTLKPAQDLLKLTRLGQTEVGSFVVSIICPLLSWSPESSELEHLNLYGPEEGQHIEKSFSRRVNVRLSRSLIRLKNLIDRNRFEEFVAETDSQPENVISINFLDALSHISDSRSESDLETRMSWSPALPLPLLPAETILFTHEHLQAVRNLATHYRPKDTDDYQTIVGYVSDLSAEGEVAKRNQGKISLTYTPEKGPRKKVTTTLDLLNYRQAVAAHDQGKQILIKGRLLKKEIDDIIQFQVL